MEKVWYRRSLALIGVIAVVACSGFMYQIAATGDVTGNLPGPLTVEKLQGRTLDSAAPTTGNTITWDGSKWAPAMFNWSNLTGTAPNISTFANNAGYLTSVNWTSVSGRPTALSQFSNDVPYVTSGGTVANATNATNAANWTGADQIDIFIGGSTSTALVSKTVPAAYLNVATDKNLSQVNCATDTGTLSLEVTRESGGVTNTIASGITCSSSGGFTTSLSTTYIGTSMRIGYILSSVSGSPTSLAIALKFTR